MLRRLLSTVVALALLSCAATIAMEALGLLFLTGPADPRQRLEAFIAQIEASLGPGDVPSEARVDQIWPSREGAEAVDGEDHKRAEIVPLPVSLPVEGDVGPAPALEDDADIKPETEPRIAVTAPVVRAGAAVVPAEALAGSDEASAQGSAKASVAAASGVGLVEPAAKTAAPAAPVPAAVAMAPRAAPAVAAVGGAVADLLKNAADCGSACAVKATGATKTRQATVATGSRTRPVERARPRAPRAARSVACPLLGWLGA